MSKPMRVNRDGVFFIPDPQCNVIVEAHWACKGQTHQADIKKLVAAKADCCVASSLLCCTTKTTGNITPYHQVAVVCIGHS